VKVPPSPTLPFDEEEMAAIFEACDRYPIKGIYNHGNRQRMKALTLLLRNSGLRIRDAITCARARERLVGSSRIVRRGSSSHPQSRNRRTCSRSACCRGAGTRGFQYLILAAYADVESAGE